MPVYVPRWDSRIPVALRIAAPNPSSSEGMPSAADEGVEVPAEGAAGGVNRLFKTPFAMVASLSAELRGGSRALVAENFACSTIFLIRHRPVLKRLEAS